jgi:alpha-1,3-rhamnosyl/mannosyltransferase
VAGDAALHFEAGDAEELRTRLERVLTDGELRRGLRDRGLTRAGEFSWSRCVEETLACYRSVL